MSTNPTRETTLSDDRDESTGGYGDGDPGRFTRDRAEEPGESPTNPDPDEGPDHDETDDDD